MSRLFHTIRITGLKGRNCIYGMVSLVWIKQVKLDQMVLSRDVHPQHQNAWKTTPLLLDV